MKLFYSIEGNIGAGKTTLLECLKKRYLEKECKKELPEKINFLNEPIKKWQKLKFNFGNDSIFSLFCNDMKTYAFPFELNALITLFKRNITKGLYQNITERSPLSVLIFSNVFNTMGLIDECQYDIIKDTYKLLYDTYKRNASEKIIYLNVSPKKCFERIEKRNRQGESNISIEQLHLLNDVTERYIRDFIPEEELIEVFWEDELLEPENLVNLNVILDDILNKLFIK